MLLMLKYICTLNVSQLQHFSIYLDHAWFQASATKQMRTALSRAIMQWRAVIPYRHFGTTYQFPLQGWLPQYKLDILLIRTIVKTHKTTNSACYGPVLHCYKRILRYLQILYGQIWMHLIISPCFHMSVLCTITLRIFVVPTRSVW